jgi:Domain of unknown function (DUF5664)
MQITHSIFELPDSGKREEFSTGSRRDTREGKGRYDLLPWCAIERIAKHTENGAHKYGDKNWEKGQPVSRYFDSAVRHLSKWIQHNDTEDHLAAACWNILAIMWTLEKVQEGKLPSTLGDDHEHRFYWGQQSRKEEQNEPAQDTQKGT